MNDSTRFGRFHQQEETRGRNAHFAEITKTAGIYKSLPFLHLVEPVESGGEN